MFNERPESGGFVYDRFRIAAKCGGGSNARWGHLASAGEKWPAWAPRGAAEAAAHVVLRGVPAGSSWTSWQCSSVVLSRCEAVQVQGVAVPDNSPRQGHVQWSAALSIGGGGTLNVVSVPASLHAARPPRPRRPPPPPVHPWASRREQCGTRRDTERSKSACLRVPWECPRVVQGERAGDEGDRASRVPQPCLEAITRHQAHDMTSNCCKKRWA